MAQAIALSVAGILCAIRAVIDLRARRLGLVFMELGACVLLIWVAVDPFLPRTVSVEIRRL